jgi:serine/threonine-protein kinase HipA
MIAFPLARRRGQYLLKLNPPEFPRVVENEAFFLRAARNSGIPVPRFEVIADRNGEHGLLVYRFDRVTNDGVEVSLAFEDGCQVLGRYPADKYRVSIEEVIGGLSAAVPARAVALMELFRLVIFACVSGNGDLHSRNLAILDSGSGEWRVAPAFDVPCTAVYGDHTMALPIGGKSREVLSRAQALTLADEIGLARRAAERVIDRLSSSVPAWMSQLDQLPFEANRIRDLKRFLANRHRLLAA